MKKFIYECESMGLKVLTLHTSGHADEDTIRNLISRVNHNEIFSINTKNAKWVEDNYSEKFLINLILNIS